MVLVTKDFLILVADDDPDDQDFITDALKSNSFRGTIQCVGDGEQLLRYLKELPTPPGLILLDLNMPLKDGYQTLHELKADPILKKIPTIVLTSSSRQEDEQQCYKLGCDKFYRKPMSINDYQSIASELLSEFGMS